MTLLLNSGCFFTYKPHQDGSNTTLKLYLTTVISTRGNYAEKYNQFKTILASHRERSIYIYL
jgi:hypothetical protein